MTNVLEDKDAIRELMAQYCFHFDSGEFDQWLDLFTADGVFDLGKRGRHVGRDGLGSFLKTIPLTDGLPMMRHCVMNSIVRVDGDRATARSYVLVVRGGAQVAVSIAGRYEDQLAKVDGTWRFAERRVHFDFMAGR